MDPNLQSQIEQLLGLAEPQLLARRDYALGIIADLRAALNTGVARAASRDPSGRWVVHDWVKRGILLGFKLGQLIDYSIDDSFRFFDKDTWPLRKLTPTDGVRVVPGGTSIRDGSFVGRGVVIMPPAYINVGAYVDEGTMIDSHALIGSCAQIGKSCHISAAAQIGGVLEPVGAMPVVIEDDVLVGGNCGVYEGTIIRQRAVIAAGVILTASTPVYDLVRGVVLRRNKEAPLEVPENAVVVPGTRPVSSGKAKEWGLALHTPIIVKYRDEKTDLAAQLEDLLR